DEDNLTNKVNTPGHETLDYWYQLKILGAMSPKIDASDSVYISVRDMEAPESKLIKRKKITTVSVADQRERETEPIISDIVNYLEKRDLIYVSFDVDSMDPSISRGTGTPVPNGFTEREAGNLVARLCAHPKICCFELVEVNPTLDSENLMAENAYEILVRAINALTND